MNRVVTLTFFLISLLSDIYSQGKIIKNDCKCLDSLQTKMDIMLKNVISNKRYEEICGMKKKILIDLEIDTNQQIQVQRIISKDLLTIEEIDSLFKYFGFLKQEPCECSNDMPEFIKVGRNTTFKYVVPLPLCEELEKLEKE